MRRDELRCVDGDAHWQAPHDTSHVGGILPPLQVAQRQPGRRSGSGVQMSAPRHHQFGIEAEARFGGLLLDHDEITLSRAFAAHERQAQALVAAQLALPAYEQVLKAAHSFNLLDARGAISVTERAAYIGRIRNLARSVAQSYYDSRERLGFPMAPPEWVAGMQKKPVLGKVEAAAQA